MRYGWMNRRETAKVEENYILLTVFPKAFPNSRLIWKFGSIAKETYFLLVIQFKQIKCVSGVGSMGDAVKVEK